MADTTITEALRRLAPSAGAEERAYLGIFRELATLLLDRTTLRIAGRPHRFTELEMYWNGLAHPDPFTHGDPMQRQLGAWYFHRSGGRYRGGTYKGLDLAIGSAEAFGGILIRGVERLELPDPGSHARGGSLIDGPCMVVDHILALTASPTIEELVRRGGVSIADERVAEDRARLGEEAMSIERGDRRDPPPPLYIELDPGPGRGRPIYATPRIGLTLKKGSTEARRRYLARPYRFLSEPARIRKGKPHLVTALHLQGRAPAEIAALTGTRRPVVEGYLAAFEAGRARPLDELGGDLSTEELCQLLRACAATAA